MDLQQLTLELDAICDSESASHSPIKTRKQRESKLDSLREDILARRGQGKSYRQIQDWLCNVKGVEVNHSTIFDFVVRCLSE